MFSFLRPQYRTRIIGSTDSFELFESVQSYEPIQKWHSNTILASRLAIPLALVLSAGSTAYSGEVRKSRPAHNFKCELTITSNLSSDSNSAKTVYPWNPEYRENTGDSKSANKESWYNEYTQVETADSNMDIIANVVFVGRCLKNMTLKAAFGGDTKSADGKTIYSYITESQVNPLDYYKDSCESVKTLTANISGSEMTPQFDEQGDQIPGPTYDLKLKCTFKLSLPGGGGKGRGGEGRH